MNKNQIKRKEQNAAMQELLDANRKMREMGFSTESINDRLRPALVSYKREQYERAKDYAHSPIFTCIAI